MGNSRKLHHAFIGEGKVVLSMSKSHFDDKIEDAEANEYLVELGIPAYSYMDKFETSHEVSLIYRY